MAFPVHAAKATTAVDRPPQGTRNPVQGSRKPRRSGC